ncbi:hypothetical protein [Nonomuraea sp. NPDC050643]|uniref:hypothetical protein n=1 Tax=Nonomuraea sp. NPDC050643 TaxID=3155660 RepID=UPI0033FB5D32
MVWPRLEDLWGNLAAPLADPQDVYLSPLWDIASLVEVGARRMGAQLALTLPVIPAERTLGMGDAANSLGIHAIAASVREGVRAGFAGRPGVRSRSAVVDRAIALGWAADRTGFQRLVAEIGMTMPELVPGSEMSRLARSGRAWYQIRFLSMTKRNDGAFEPGAQEAFWEAGYLSNYFTVTESTGDEVHLMGSTKFEAVDIHGLPGAEVKGELSK